LIKIKLDLNSVVFIPRWCIHGVFKRREECERKKNDAKMPKVTTFFHLMER